MLVHFPGLFEQPARFGRISMPAKFDQGFCVSPGGRVLLRVLVEKASHFVIAILAKQEPGERIASALVVIGIEPKHVL